jgi:serine protease Do
MRPSILLSLILTSWLVVGAFCTQCPVVERPAGPYALSVATDTGFSGDEENTGAYLGVDITDVTKDRLAALKLKDERGVELTMVDQDAPAGQAGLKEHDVILTMNGTNVESAAQLRRMIRETPPGRAVTFGVSRDGQPITIKVLLADRRKHVSWASKSKDFKFEMPEMPSMPDFDLPVSVVVVHSSMRSGLLVENITPQLGDFFGVKNGKGVLIRSVEKGSRAEKAGFRAGDVIVRVNEQTVHDTSDFSHALRSGSSSTVTVGIIRDKKEQNLSLPLPDRKDSGGLFEESLDAPEVDAEEMQVDLSKMREEIAQVRPQMQYAIERALREGQSVTGEVQRSLCDRQKALRDQAQKMRQQLQKQREQILKQNRRQMERIRHEMRGDWVQI